MWLSDYEKAVRGLLYILGDFCIESITHSYDGERFIFKLTNKDCYVYYRKTERIIKTTPDTWRTGEVKEIYKGKVEENG